jgi:hypothetical protein
MLHFGRHLPEHSALRNGAWDVVLGECANVLVGRKRKS